MGVLKKGKGKEENASKRENLGKARKIPIQVQRKTLTLKQKKKAIISADEPPRSRVFVRGPQEVLSKAFLRRTFASYGNIQYCKLLAKSKYRLRRMAYVKFSEASEAAAAVNAFHRSKGIINDRDLGNVDLVVNIALPKKTKGDSKKPLSTSEKPKKKKDPAPVVASSKMPATKSNIERDICLHFIAGYCRWGKKCLKRHPPEAEADVMRKILSHTRCRFWKRCDRKNCLFRHPDTLKIGAESAGVALKQNTKIPGRKVVPRKPDAVDAGPQDSSRSRHPRRDFSGKPTIRTNGRPLHRSHHRPDSRTFKVNSRDEEERVGRRRDHYEKRIGSFRKAREPMKEKFSSRTSRSESRDRDGTIHESDSDMHHTVLPEGRKHVSQWRKWSKPAPKRYASLLTNVELFRPY